MIRRLLTALPLLVIGCASTRTPPPSELGCEVRRVEGQCRALTIIEPREPESMEEAASLIVRWEWVKPALDGSVPARERHHHLSWGEASARAEVMTREKHSPCVLEEATGPERCLGLRAIVEVQAEP